MIVDYKQVLSISLVWDKSVLSANPPGDFGRAAALKISEPDRSFFFEYQYVCPACSSVCLFSNLATISITLFVMVGYLYSLE